MSCLTTVNLRVANYSKEEEEEDEGEGEEEEEEEEIILWLEWGLLSEAGNNELSYITSQN